VALGSRSICCSIGSKTWDCFGFEDKRTDSAESVTFATQVTLNVF